MKNTLLTLILVFTSYFNFAQTAEDEIRSPRLKNGRIYFNHQLEFKTNPNDHGYGMFRDSSLFTISSADNADNYFVFVEAYNPLHYSMKAEENIVQNQVDMDVLAMLNKIQVNEIKSEMILESAFQNKLSELKGKSIISNEDYLKAKEIDIQEFMKDELGLEEFNKKFEGYNLDLMMLFVQLKEEKVHNTNLLEQQRAINKVKSSLANSGTAQFAELLQELIDLDFKSKIDTELALKKIEKELKSAESQYKTINDELKSLNEASAEALKNIQLPLELKMEYLFLKDQSRDLNEVFNEQLKMLHNLRNASDLILSTLKKQSNSIVANGQWYFTAIKGDMPESSDKITEISLTITNHRKKIENGSLVNENEEVTNRATFSLVKFRLFVPEVSAGIIWTKQDFRDFGTTTDGNGTRTVGLENDSPAYEQIAITSMINWNLNCSKSPILPFIQTGVGLNGQVPMALLGAGLRIDFGTQRTFGVSIGASFTGIQELSTLNLGDVVTDQLEIENDLEYNFSGPRLYFGIQYDF